MTSYLDVHHHIIPPFYVQAVGEAAVSAGFGIPPWNPELALDAMERYGIAKAVVSISNPGIAVAERKAAATLARRCNDYMKQMSVDHVGRFDGFAAMPMPAVDDTLREITYALDRLQLAGIGLLTNYDGLYLGDPHFDRVLAELNARDAIVFVHPTSNPSAPFRKLVPPPLVEFPHDTTWTIVSLIVHGAFSRYRRIKFISSHAGGTMLSIGARFILIKDPGGAAAMDLLKQCYYDLALSATPFTVPALVNFVGGDRIVFGSDFPFAPEPVLKMFDSNLAHFAAQHRDALPLLEKETALKVLMRSA
jgi:predicted TIM-barrel fold metal-dependent hydrolase